TDRCVAYHFERQQCSDSFAEYFFEISAPALGHSFLSASYFSVAALSILSKLTVNAGKLMLAGHRDMVMSSRDLRHLVSAIPKDPRTVLGKFAAILDPVVDVYLCCPSCFELYPLEETSPEALPFCTHRETPSSIPCGSELWHRVGNNTKLVPIARFEFQNFKLWLGRMLSRKDIEAHLNAARSRLRRHVMRAMRDANRVHDIHYTEGPFLGGPTSELRLIVSWSNDGWNPFYNKSSGNPATSTGFWLVLDDLPLGIRFLPENIFYLGALPGKPKGSRLNPVIRLLAHYFLEFWHPGIRYSRTAHYPTGRLVKAVLVPQFSDVLATRQASGHGAVRTEEFCVFCKLKFAHIECMDRALWPARDTEEERQRACMWRDAQTDEERTRLREEHVVRYTPLIELPYHDPIRDNIPDILHLRSNMIENWIRKTLRVHLVIDGELVSEEYKEDVEARPSVEIMRSALQMLRDASDEEGLDALKHRLCKSTWTRSIVWTLCKDHGLRYAGTMEQLAYILVNWVRTAVYSSDESSPICCEYRCAYHCSPWTCLAVDRTQSDAMTDDHSEVQSNQSVMASASNSAPTSAYWAITEGENALLQSSTGKAVCLALIDRRKESTIHSKAKRRDVLVALCKSLRITYTQASKTTTKKLATISTLIGRLQEFPRRELLTTSVMLCIRDVIERTILPDFIDRVPLDWGTKGRGKLTGGQWRVLSQIYFPIALIPEWGVPSASAYLQEVLNTHMHLVDAMYITDLLELSQEQSYEYDTSMLSHVTEKMRLFKDVALVPYDHLAVHNGDVLRDYGPSATHNGSYYERYIRHLHSFNINMKSGSGQIEATYLRGAVRSANLRALLLDDSPLLHEVSSLVEEHQRQSYADVRGTKLGSLLLESSVTRSVEGAKVLRTRVKSINLSARLCSLLPSFLNRRHHTNIYGREISISRMAGQVTRASIRNIRYCTYEDLAQNSNIVFALSPGSSTAGRITDMFLHEHTLPSGDHAVSSLILVIKPYGALMEGERFLDAHYRAHKNGGFCCRRSVGESILVGVDMVLGHASISPVEYNGFSLLHILPLARVSPSIRLSTPLALFWCRSRHRYLKTERPCS
ncbi:hypothetical protein PENSPDRAFT_589077, partial [Peniophora sp. CONT]